MQYDVIIVGAGVIGGMVARELSRYQLRVCLLEKENDVAMGASKANSGIIHGGYDPVPGTLKAKMNTLGRNLLYEAARELHVPYKNNGALVCAFGSEEEHRVLDQLLDRSRENGVEGLSVISGDEARKLEPALSDQVSRALSVPCSGIICPYDLTIAAVGNAMDNGVELRRNFAVSRIETGEQFTVHAGSGETVTGRWLINCAGGWSDRIAALCGDGFFTIIPRAGEYQLLDKTEGGLVRHTIFQVPTADGKGILVTPTVDGNLLTGPTAAKVEGPASTETTKAGLDKVAKLAAKSVPGVNFRQVITSFTGVRASERHGDFIIEPSKKVERLFHVAAIDSPGLTSCVAIAKETVRQLKGLGLPLEEKKAWDGHREDAHAFRHLSLEEQNAFIQTHPAYGRVICRCETVSEGEMVEAIHRNPPAWDLDGIKRRTRGGMGRCQGGFCSPYVMELLARELQRPIEAITKSGPGSELVWRGGEDR